VYLLDCAALLLLVFVMAAVRSTSLQLTLLNMMTFWCLV